MFKVFVFGVLLFTVGVQCQTWNSRACLVGHTTYYTKVMQEVFRQIEQDVKWCNLKMDDRGQVINEQLFKWHPKGTVNYTDGFVVSIGKIDLTNIQHQVATRTVNETQTSQKNVHGRVNLRDLNIGFDVIANLEDSGAHRFTGTYSHTLIILQAAVGIAIF